MKPLNFRLSVNFVLILIFFGFPKWLGSNTWQRANSANLRHGFLFPKLTSASTRSRLLLAGAPCQMQWTGVSRLFESFRRSRRLRCLAIRRPVSVRGCTQRGSFIVFYLSGGFFSVVFLSVCLCLRPCPFFIELYFFHRMKQSWKLSA